MGPATPPEGIRVLVVDDNIDHVQLALRALRADPTLKLDTVRLGQEAIERVLEGSYDLVLLDYRLPDLTGLEVLQRIRKAKGEQAIILMTSQGSEEVAMDALNAGAVSYVVKNADFGRRLAYEVREWIVENRSG